MHLESGTYSSFEAHPGGGELSCKMARGGRVGGLGWASAVEGRIKCLLHVARRVCFPGSPIPSVVC